MAAAPQRSLRRQIGDRLRKMRTATGISSQEKLGERAGLHRTYIGRLERGDSGVTVETLATLLAAMGVTLAAFFAPFDSPLRPRTPRKRDG